MIKPQKYLNPKVVVAIETELLELIEKHGSFPPSEKLRKLNGYLYKLILNTGGIDKYRAKLGYKLKRHSSGYWTHENVKKEILKFIEDNGHFPAQRELRKRGYGYLAAVIEKTGGFPKYKKELDYPVQKSKASGYWKNPEKRKNEFEKVKSKLGRIPIYSELGSSLLNAIQKYDGGYKNFLIKFGQCPIKTQKDFLEFLTEKREAKTILQLGLTDDRYLSEAIEILAKLFPNRINPQTTINIVDSSIESLLSYLGHVELQTSTSLDCLPTTLLENIPETLFKSREFEQLLFDVSRDSYMKDFNSNPSSVLNSIRRQLREISNPLAREVLERALRYYKELLGYRIPGITRIREVV
jgi:hypothetical protein